MDRTHSPFEADGRERGSDDGIEWEDVEMTVGASAMS
jgi:hypothetical protein